jgi:hypothetical protein
VYVPAACPGSTVGRERVACSGPALIQLTYSEAKRQEGLSLRLADNRRDAADVEGRLLATTPTKYVTAAAQITNVLHRLLLAHEKDLGRGLVGSNNFQLACQLFCLLGRAGATEAALALPALRHFLSTCLDTLAGVVGIHWREMAPAILGLLVELPHLAPLLTPHFAPQVEELRIKYRLPW